MMIMENFDIQPDLPPEEGERLIYRKMQYVSEEINRVERALDELSQHKQGDVKNTEEYHDLKQKLMQRINALKECRGADDDTEQIISKNLDQLYAQLEIINENITALHLSINRSEAGVEDINKRKQELTDQLDVLGDMLAADPEKN